MAEPGKTVRVRGLPTDIEDDRLKDKLFIHFLRTSNGGGEVDAVIIVKATPASALITFEDREVAQRIIQRRRHILEVDGKKYTLTATEHHETLNPDQVILSLAATVDYSQLPGGVMALASLRQSHPDVQMNYTDTAGYCTVCGDYSKVRAALEQMLEQSLSAEKSSGLPGPSRPTSVQTARSQEPEQQRRKINNQKNKFNSSPNTDQPPGSYGWEDISQTDGATLQPPPTSVEDFSLILDADMFQYLQKQCREEYQYILRHYGVEVLDVTNHGVTTLYLHVAAASREGGREQERLKKANKAISRLYQENETKVRQAQLPKSILTPKGGLQRAMDILSGRLPKLLLMEDERNVYIIGSSNDVSEAKSFFLGPLDPYKERDEKENVASLRIRPSYSSGEERSPLTTSSPAESLDDRIDQMLRSEEDESKADGGRRYKLAARFKDSGLTPLSSRTTDFTLRANPSTSRQTRPGPMLGHDVLSERAGISAQAAQNTGGDILFKTALPSSASLQDKISLNSDLMGAQPKSLMSPFSTSQTGSSVLPPAGSGSTLKRASSFSGMPQQKARVMSQKSQDESTVRARGRSSSFSTQIERDKQGVSEAEITVPHVMWRYIKEAYSTRVEDLTSDVQMKERRSEGNTDLTLTLRGADSSTVSSCQLGLQKLVDSVSSNFSVQELPLSELHVTETDETLQACCSEVRSRFKKVSIQVSKKSVYLLGPEQLCSQVRATLLEVFSGDLVQNQHYVSSPPLWSSLQKNEDQSDSNSPVMVESQTGKTDRSQEWRTTYSTDFGGKEVMNGSISRPVNKDHVVKENVRITDVVETAGQKSESHVNGVGLVTNCAAQERTAHSTPIESKEQQRTESQNKPEDSSSDQGDQGYICESCGKSGTSRTNCGVTMCSKCLDTVHSHCRVCHETERMPRGIHGKIIKSKIHISVPGHSKAGAIKIKYCIPDGIQGEGHPSPGQPFHGGIFEAFLPDCEKTRKLLPRLEKAFKWGLTFTVTGKEEEARVSWDCIPHKTSLQGGKSGNGYPDSTYLTRLSDILTSHGIEEQPARSPK